MLKSYSKLALGLPQTDTHLYGKQFADLVLYLYILGHFHHFISCNAKTLNELLSTEHVLLTIMCKFLQKILLTSMFERWWFQPPVREPDFKIYHLLIGCLFSISKINNYFISCQVLQTLQFLCF